MSKKQYGFVFLEVILVLIIAGILGGTGYYVWHSKNNVNKSYANSSDVSANIPKYSTIKTFYDCKKATGSKVLETDPEQCITKDGMSFTSFSQTVAPSGWIVYESKDVGVKFAYPQNWTRFQCDGSAAVIFLIKKTSVKCGTEDRADGPTIFKDRTNGKPCSGQQIDDPSVTQSCKEISIGNYKIALTAGTQKEEGVFGEPIGAIFYGYEFQGSDIRVAYSQWPGEVDQKATVEKIISTIQTL